MAWLPIPISKFGSKENNTKQKLTPEVRKQIRENKRRAHTIKDVRKNRQKTDLLSQKKINDIKDLMEKYSVNYVRNISLIADFAVEDGLFNDKDIARMFIISFKEKIFV